MHHTYSLRDSRAPTNSQLQTPAPPPSTTKGGKFFGKSSFSGNLRKSTAGTFGPQLARKLTQYIKIEKNVMRAIELAARERREVAKQLSLWGAENEDDISDITDKLGVLLYEIAELEDQFIDKYDQYRITLKHIRNIEASAQPTRDRKQKITDEIAHLKYKDPSSPKLEVLEQELVRAEAESLVAEAQLSNITREKLKLAFQYQFDAMIELSEKLALIAGYGKALLELLDDNSVTPGEGRHDYDGYDTTKQIIIDAETSLRNWTLDSAAVKPSLSFHHTVDDVYEEEEEEDDEGYQGQTSAVDGHTHHGTIGDEVDASTAHEDLTNENRTNLTNEHSTRV